MSQAGQLLIILFSFFTVYSQWFDYCWALLFYSANLDKCLGTSCSSKVFLSCFSFTLLHSEMPWAIQQQYWGCSCKVRPYPVMSWSRRLRPSPPAATWKFSQALLSTTGQCTAFPIGQSLNRGCANSCPPPPFPHPNLKLGQILCLVLNYLN